MRDGRLKDDEFCDFLSSFYLQLRRDDRNEMRNEKNDFGKNKKKRF